jgi:hypothetical protein
MKLVTEEQKERYIARASSINRHDMFRDIRHSAGLAVAEWLANQDGFTFYQHIAESEDAAKSCGLLGQAPSAPKTEYKMLAGSETYGKHPEGVRIMVALSREFTTEDQVNAMRCIHTLNKQLRRETVRLDPQTEKDVAFQRGKFEAAFMEAGFSVVYMEPAPNEYFGDDAEALSSPWYVVTTPRGHIKVGWRKRVIVLDWERSEIQASAHQLFPQEDVTKGDRMIHCWTYEKLAQYLTALKAVGPLE